MVPTVFKYQPAVFVSRHRPAASVELKVSLKMIADDLLFSHQCHHVCQLEVCLRYGKAQYRIQFCHCFPRQRSSWNLWEFCLKKGLHINAWGPVRLRCALSSISPEALQWVIDRQERLSCRLPLLLMTARSSRVNRGTLGIRFSGSLLDPLNQTPEDQPPQHWYSI